MARDRRQYRRQRCREKKAEGICIYCWIRPAKEKRVGCPDCLERNRLTTRAGKRCAMSFTEAEVNVATGVLMGLLSGARPVHLARSKEFQGLARKFNAAKRRVEERKRGAA